jgi:hypothetical protein
MFIAEPGRSEGMPTLNLGRFAFRGAPVAFACVVARAAHVSKNRPGLLLSMGSSADLSKSFLHHFLPKADHILLSKTVSNNRASSIHC